MRRVFGAAALAAAAVAAFAVPARATPVDTVALADGNVLDIEGVVGSGNDASYEIIDFGKTGGPSFAWEYQWSSDGNPSDNPDGWDMLVALQGANVGFSMDSGYFQEYQEHYINNFTYTTGTGNSVTYTGDPSDYWQYYNGAYDPVAQAVDWVSSGNGPDDVTLTNGSFDGWYNSFDPADPTPAIPETAAPEPSSVAVLLMGSTWLLRRERRRARRGFP